MQFLFGFLQYASMALGPASADATTRKPEKENAPNSMVDISPPLAAFFVGLSLGCWALFSRD